MEFVEAPAFTRNLPQYMKDDQYTEMQARLATHPELGDLIPGTGGFRKMRWSDARRGKGTRGGLRVIYYHFASDRQIWLMTIYDKAEATDLTPKEKKALKAAIESELKARRAKLSGKSQKARRIQ